MCFFFQIARGEGEGICLPPLPQMKSWMYIDFPIKLATWRCYDHPYCVSEWAEICNRTSNCIWLHHQINQAFPSFLVYVEKHGKTWYEDLMIICPIFILSRNSPRWTLTRYIKQAIYHITHRSWLFLIKFLLLLQLFIKLYTRGILQDDVDTSGVEKVAKQMKNVGMPE